MSKIISLIYAILIFFNTAYVEQKQNFNDNIDSTMAVEDHTVETSMSVPTEYEYIYPYTEGLAAVLYDGKVGFIDENGNEIIPCIYDYVRNFGPDDGYNFSCFQGGLSRVRLDG
ncbi:MAG: WG repeat-containing protein [Oscillospiraceae bacterium]|nr:WG repeat-containing protein [Oscillospiraceae bacterium]